MTLFFLWLPVAIVGYALGKIYRNRALSGFLLGFFLGPIGWALVVALKDMRLRCAHCGAVVNKGYRICGQCGHEIETKPRPASSNDDPELSNLISRLQK